MHPGLIFRNARQLAILVDIRAAVADAGDQQLGAVLERSHQSGSHSFQIGVAGSGIHHALVGFLESLGECIGVAHSSIFNERSHCFDGHLGGVLSGLRAAHPVGHDIQAGGRRQQKGIFVVLADAARIGESVSFEHQLRIIPFPALAKLDANITAYPAATQPSIASTRFLRNCS